MTAPPLESEAGIGAVAIRAVRATDGAALDAFFSQLSPQSRRRRFHGAVNRLPAAVIERFAQPDPQHEWAMLAFVAIDGREVCIGEARYAAGDGMPGDREFALVVADGWQRRGLGTRLLRGLIHHASRRGIERLLGDVQRDNLPMIALARRLGFGVGRHPENAVLLRLERRLHTPSAATLPIPPTREFGLRSRRADARCAIHGG